MEILESKQRLRRLAEAAEISIDSNIPIRRYYRSGTEMLRMAKVHLNEGNLEATYVLYMKYISLFLEKIMTHRDFGQVLPAEKKKTKETLKLVLSLTEETKSKLDRIFQEEHEDWLIREEERRKEEDIRKREEEERNRRRATENLKRLEMIEKDRQFAILAQEEINRELAGETSKPAEYKPEKYLPSPSNEAPPSYASVADQYSPQPSSAPPYEEPKNDFSSAQDRFRSDASAPAPPPVFDRSAKPSSSIQNNIVFDSGSHIRPDFGSNIRPDSGSQIRPVIPDRSKKPEFAPKDLHGVTVPEKLIQRFLALAKPNSDKNIETLGMLGGKLAKNRFTVTHLLIPKQTGKSDRCDLEGYEELFDLYDKEDIIMVGWIHTHPAYDVFLSSVDMHNQYEYQKMLKEFIAIVCSIKFGETGYLSLTEQGLQEIGNCNLENFHPHSKDPPLFSEASHVTVDPTLEIKVTDLR